MIMSQYMFIGPMNMSNAHTGAIQPRAERDQQELKAQAHDGNGSQQALVPIDR